MKENKLFVALTALVLMACNKQPEIIVPQEADYKGTVTVEFKGEPYDNENIEVKFTPSEDGKTASLTIYKIRFVPQMPVTIDVTIPNIELTANTTEFTLKCDEVIPLAMGGEYPRYKVTNLKGVIDHGTLDFSLNFGDFPTSFTGRQLLK